MREHEQEAELSEFDSLHTDKIHTSVHASTHTCAYTYQMFLVHLLIFLLSWWVWLSEFEFHLAACGCPSSF